MMNSSLSSLSRHATGTAGTAAFLNQPDGLALDQAGDLLIYDRLNQQLRSLSPDGRLGTEVGLAANATAAPSLPAPTSQWPVYGRLTGTRQSAVVVGPDGTIS